MLVLLVVAALAPCITGIELVEDDTVDNIDFDHAVLDHETGMMCVHTNTTEPHIGQETLLKCRHGLVSVCHYTYITKYKNNKEEQCEEIFSKRCKTVFKKDAQNITTQHCYKPVVRKCKNYDDDVEKMPGQSFCKVVFETECRTTYEETDDKKHQQPKTACKRIPKTLCGSKDCVFMEEEEQCHNKSNTLVKTVPEETCEINPRKICKNVNKLVPYLDPVSQCKNVPKEKCTFGIKNNVGEKNLITKWCYGSSEGYKKIKFPEILSDKRKGRLFQPINNNNILDKKQQRKSFNKPIRFPSNDDSISKTKIPYQNSQAPFAGRRNEELKGFGVLHSDLNDGDHHSFGAFSFPESSATAENTKSQHSESNRLDDFPFHFISQKPLRFEDSEYAFDGPSYESQGEKNGFLESFDNHGILEMKKIIHNSFTENQPESFKHKQRQHVEAITHANFGTHFEKDVELFAKEKHENMIAKSESLKSMEFRNRERERFISTDLKNSVKDQFKTIKSQHFENTGTALKQSSMIGNKKESTKNEIEMVEKLVDGSVGKGNFGKTKVDEKSSKTKNEHFQELEASTTGSGQNNKDLLKNSDVASTKGKQFNANTPKEASKNDNKLLAPKTNSNKQRYKKRNKIDSDDIRLETKDSFKHDTNSQKQSISHVKKEMFFNEADENTSNEFNNLKQNNFSLKHEKTKEKQFNTNITNETLKKDYKFLEHTKDSKTNSNEQMMGKRKKIYKDGILLKTKDGFKHDANLQKQNISHRKKEMSNKGSEEAEENTRIQNNNLMQNNFSIKNKKTNETLKNYDKFLGTSQASESNLKKQRYKKTKKIESDDILLKTMASFQPDINLQNQTKTFVEAEENSSDEINNLEQKDSSIKYEDTQEKSKILKVKDNLIINGVIQKQQSDKFRQKGQMMRNSKVLSPKAERKPKSNKDFSTFGNKQNLTNLHFDLDNVSVDKSKEEGEFQNAGSPSKSFLNSERSNQINSDTLSKFNTNKRERIKIEQEYKEENTPGRQAKLQFKDEHQPKEELQYKQKQKTNFSNHKDLSKDERNPLIVKTSSGSLRKQKVQKSNKHQSEGQVKRKYEPDDFTTEVKNMEIRAKFKIKESEFYKPGTKGENNSRAISNGQKSDTERETKDQFLRTLPDDKSRKSDFHINDKLSPRKELESIIKEDKNTLSGIYTNGHRNIETSAKFINANQQPFKNHISEQPKKATNNLDILRAKSEKERNEGKDAFHNEKEQIQKNEVNDSNNEEYRFSDSQNDTNGQKSNFDLFAKVIENSEKDGIIQRTVIIKNTPEAHRVFGVKNAPLDMLKSQKITSTEKETFNKNDKSSFDLSNILDDIYKNEKVAKDNSIIEKVRNPKVLNENIGSRLRDQDIGESSILDNLSIKSHKSITHSGGNFLKDEESLEERNKIRKDSAINKEMSESTGKSGGVQFSFFNQFEFEKISNKSISEDLEKTEEQMFSKILIDEIMINKEDENVANQNINKSRHQMKNINMIDVEDKIRAEEIKSSGLSSFGMKETHLRDDILHRNNVKKGNRKQNIIGKTISKQNSNNKGQTITQQDIVKVRENNRQNDFGVRMVKEKGDKDQKQLENTSVNDKETLEKDKNQLVAFNIKLENEKENNKGKHSQTINSNNDLTTKELTSNNQLIKKTNDEELSQLIFFDEGKVNEIDNQIKNLQGINGGKALTDNGKIFSDIKPNQNSNIPKLVIDKIQKQRKDKNMKELTTVFLNGREKIEKANSDQLSLLNSKDPGRLKDEKESHTEKDLETLFYEDIGGSNSHTNQNENIKNVLVIDTTTKQIFIQPITIPLNGSIGEEETILKDALKNLDKAVPIRKNQGERQGKESATSIDSKDINKFLRNSQQNKNMKVVQINNFIRQGKKIDKNIKDAPRITSTLQQSIADRESSHNLQDPNPENQISIVRNPPKLDVINPLRADTENEVSSFTIVQPNFPATQQVQTDSFKSSINQFIQSPAAPVILSNRVHPSESGDTIEGNHNQHGHSAAKELKEEVTRNLLLDNIVKTMTHPVEHFTNPFDINNEDVNNNIENYPTIYVVTDNAHNAGGSEYEIFQAESGRSGANDISVPVANYRFENNQAGPVIDTQPVVNNPLRTTYSNNKETVVTNSPDNLAVFSHTSKVENNLHQSDNFDNTPNNDKSSYSTKPGFFMTGRKYQQDRGEEFIGSQYNLQTITTQDPKYILTNRPMTFQKASGKILLPATLNYGFEPITTPPTPPHTTLPHTKQPYKQNTIHTKQNKQKPRLKGYLKHKKDTTIIEFYHEANVLDKISNLLDPIKNTLKKIIT